MSGNPSAIGSNQKKVFIKTYGCQMNVYDSERLQDALEHDGYCSTSNISEADLVLLNTCHIREKAAEKVYSELGRIRKIKESRQSTGQEMLVGVTGCVAQAEGDQILARAPVVDLVAGPQTYHRISSLIGDAARGNKVVATDFEIEEKFDQLPAATVKQVRARGVAAFLTVQEGCDKFCTFCVVPYTRGAEVSRSAEKIIDEAGSLVAAGVREITLLGQNVNAWHGEAPDGSAWGLGDLLEALSGINGLDRLRYTTSHPVDMDASLIKAHRDLDCLMPYLHLPVQAGSDRILKAMNRHHTVSDYMYVIEKMREARPDLALSGDFIVGFPGETDEDFEQTMALVEDVEYASAFSFKYSARPGTPGADMENQVPEQLKTERLHRLQELLQRQQLAFNRNCIGNNLQILLEKPGKNKDQLIGRSPWLQSVVVDRSVGNPGDMIEVEITDAGPNSLTGKATQTTGGYAFAGA